MMKHTVKKVGILFLSVVYLMIITSYPASASFAVGQFCDTSFCYGLNKGFQIAPGQTKEGVIRIQNNVGGEDINLVAEVSEGQEYVTFVDGDRHLIKSGDTNYQVKLRIAAPDSLSEEDFNVVIKFTEAAASGEDTVRFSPVIGISFPVQINSRALEEVIPGEVDETDDINDNADSAENNNGSSSGSGTMILLLIVLVLSLIVIIIYFSFANRREKLTFPNA